jgi:hypothetical protein
VAIGGNIDVYCNNDTPGVLKVMENKLNGWTAKRDGLSTKLGEGQWLSTNAPAGAHHYAFRYRPWDVVAGFLLSAAGFCLAI